MKQESYEMQTLIVALIMDVKNIFSFCQHISAAVDLFDFALKYWMLRTGKRSIDGLLMVSLVQKQGHQNVIETRRANAQITHIQVQNWRKCVGYVPVTQNVPCLIISMCITTIHCLNHSGQGSNLTNLWPCDKVKVVKHGMRCWTKKPILKVLSN